MKKTILFSLATFLAMSALAADSSPKDEVTSAAKKLADQANYSWKQTMVVPADSPFQPGPTLGKAEKGGATWVSMTMNDNTTEMAMKGGKTAIKPSDDDWQTLQELEKNSGDQPGPGRFLVMIAQNFKAPPAQAEELAAKAKELKKDGDMYSGDLTADGTKELLTFRPRNGEGPTVTNPKGSVKFWINKDGVLSKYEFHLKGTIDFNGNDFDVDRDTTVEIKDVGSTKLTLPENAQKKLS